MKRLFMLCLLCVSFLLLHTTAEAEVRWDGATVVKNQVGKMTFSKDVKVYKKEKDGTFTSLVVKAGEFFRVYYVESSSVGTVYGMSNGYRVQASKLVVYRAVPLEVQSMFGVTLKETTTKLLAENRQIKTFVASNILNKLVLQSLNEQLQQLVLEISPIDLQYDQTDNDHSDFYEYEVLTNLHNRLAIFMQRSSCYQPCDIFIYEMEIKMFNVATGELLTLRDVVRDEKQRQQLEVIVNAQLPTEQRIERLPFYETDEMLYFYYNNGGKIMIVDVPKGNFAHRLLVSSR